MLMRDIDVAAQEGFPSAILSIDTSFSTLSRTMVMTHKLMPSLSGLCIMGDGLVAVFFVDELPEMNKMGGVLYYTKRLEAAEAEDGSITNIEVPNWIVQIQTGNFAWQTMSDEFINGRGMPLNKAVFLKWKPGSYPYAVERHHDLVRKLPDELFDVGSDFEKIALSTFLLSSEMSTIANTYIDEPWLKRALNGETVENINDHCVCGIKVIDVDWSVDLSLYDDDHEE